MVQHQRAVAAIVKQQPYVDNFMSSIGAGGTNVVPNTGRIFMRLKPRETRPSADEIVQDLRKKLSGIPGINVYPQVVPTIRIGGQLTKGLYQYTLQDADLASLYRWAPVLFDKLRALPGFLDVNSDLQITSPQVLVEIDRDKASALGVTAEQIESALNNAYGSPQVSTIYTPTNQYWSCWSPARVPAIPPPSACSTSADRAAARPAQRGGQLHADGGPAHYQSPASSR